MALGASSPRHWKTSWVYGLSVAIKIARLTFNDSLGELALHLLLTLLVSRIPNRASFGSKQPPGIGNEKLKEARDKLTEEPADRQQTV
ncbi:MAG: hypothetical protein O2960_30255, partial [Verrucomicrobia bacterium]|nr:hypothetical protein [Verrucomicrobiota bacterium]